MRQFKEFRMPPITMGRDNTIVGIRNDDVPEMLAKTKMGKGAKWVGKQVNIKAKLKARNAKKDKAHKDRWAAGEKKRKDAWIAKNNELEPAKRRPESDYVPTKYVARKAGTFTAVGAKAKQMMETENTIHEGKITWTRGTLSDGTMKIGIFDGDKEKALEAARQLIIFLRKNKKVKIGGDKEDTDGEPNEAIAKYSEELSKLVFDDELLDDLEPNGNNADQIANDIVFNRLRDLGVNIK